MDNTIVFIQILNSKKPDKKYVARFFDAERNMIKQTDFGSKTGLIYTHHKDEEVKENWIARHQVRGTFNEATSSSSLARWLLWNKKTLSKSFKDYLRRFNLKKY